MTDELAVIQPEAPLTAVQVKARVNLIQDVMKSVMKEGTHYDTIKGCGNKKILLKPGAEVLLCTFNVSGEPIIEDLNTLDEVHYRVKMILRNVNTGAIVGYGVGEGSSNEEKYKWRRSVCKEEFDATPEDRRRIKWSMYNKNITKTQQVRTNPADVANTVLKMTKKRGLVDATLTTFAASDIFTQDGDPTSTDNTPPPNKASKSASVTRTDAPKKDRPEGAISEGQENMIYAKAAAVGDKKAIVAEIKEAFQVKDLCELGKENINDILKYLDSKMKEKEA